MVVVILLLGEWFKTLHFGTYASFSKDLCLPILFSIFFSEKKTPVLLKENMVKKPKRPKFEVFEPNFGFSGFSAVFLT